MFLAGVDDKNGVGQAGHTLHTDEVLDQLLALGQQLDDFLFRQGVKLTLFFHLKERVHAGYALAHRAEVGQHAAQPAVVDIEHAAAARLGLDGLMRLLFGTDK